jgi:DNA-binding NarL/FixJ family response regulator
MFSEGLEACLVDTPGLEVIGHAGDPDTALQRIQALQPDLVLLITPNAGARCAWMTGADIWCANRAACCIELSLQDNCVRIYRGEQTRVNNLDDLVALMEQTLSVHPASACRQVVEGEANV